MNVALTPYTVLLLRPDWQHEGPPSDWVSRQFVDAFDAQSAAKVGIAKLLAIDSNLEETDVAVLAVFDGHQRDIYNPYEGINP